MKLYRPTLQKQPKTAKGYVACMTDQPHPADNEWNGRESREWVKFTDHAADLARADARIAELEQSVTVRDAEIAGLRADAERIDAQWRDELRIYRETENADAARYRWLRNESWSLKHQCRGYPRVAETVVIPDKDARITILADDALDAAIDAARANGGES